MTRIVLPVKPNTLTNAFYNNLNNKIQAKPMFLKEEQVEVSNKNLKMAALGGSISGSLLYLLAVAKIMNKKNFKIGDILKVDFNSALRTMGLATASLVGGLTAGLIADDKKYRKPKLKEAMHQFLGNIITPIAIVGIATSWIEKQKYSRVKSTLLGFAAAMIGVGLGVTGGNKIANVVNEKIYKEDDKRKVGIKDFGIHVDDIFAVMGMTDLGESVKSFVSKALPVVFLICGYEAGTKRGKENELS